MKNLIKLSSVIALILINACSFANKSTVTVPITSNPPGANVIIDGRNYGQTPAFVELKPSKNYKATIMKDGYTSATIDMETWWSVRNGEGADGGRCVADSLPFAIPYFIVALFAPEKCASFKEDNYYVDLTLNKIPNSQSYNNNPNQYDYYSNSPNPGYNSY